MSRNIGKTVFKAADESTAESDRCTSLFSGAGNLNCDAFRGHIKSRDPDEKYHQKVRASLDSANKGSLHDRTRQG